MRLHHRNDASSLDPGSGGLFCCEVPDSNDVDVILCANIGKSLTLIILMGINACTLSFSLPLVTDEIPTNMIQVTSATDDFGNCIRYYPPSTVGSYSDPSSMATVTSSDIAVIVTASTIIVLLTAAVVLVSIVVTVVVYR